MAVNPAIQAYSDAVNAQFDIIEPAVDGIVDDVQFLKDTIAALQNSPGSITPDDQALLDKAQARVNLLSTKIVNLDNATSRPVPPPAP